MPFAYLVRNRHVQRSPRIGRSWEEPVADSNDPCPQEQDQSAGLAPAWVHTYNCEALDAMIFVNR